MKRVISLLVICSLIFCSCSWNIKDSSVSNDSVSVQTAIEPSTNNSGEIDEIVINNTESSEEDYVNISNIDISFSGLDDEDLLRYVEDNIYSELVVQLDSSDYFVENIEAIYYPKEYIEALASNSMSNVYFGYTIEELNAQFQGTKYVFTLGEDGQTTVVPMEILTDDVYIKAMENVIVGTGVILVCVTVSIVSAPAAPAVSVIFAASASTGTAFALESGGLSFAAAAIAKGYETENLEEALKAGVASGSESYKWGAICGVVTGGVSETFALKGMTLNGLTMNEAAKIQKESGWPVAAIKSLHSMEEYEVYAKLGLTPVEMKDGSVALIRDIDWNLVDSKGRTNIQRVRDYKIAPIDASGEPFELHHIGMREDSPLAILSKDEHHSKDWYKILHYKDEGKNVADDIWKEQKKEFWSAILDMSGVTY